jgi:hypothetical protein
VKFEKADDALSAFNELSKYYNVNFVETYHSSDENKLYLGNKNEEEREASLTLNMLKIKQENLKTVSRNMEINLKSNLD